MRLHISKVVYLVLFLFVLNMSSAFAQKSEVTILEVTPDFESETIKITGENFDIGPNPTTVTLGGFGELNILSNTGTMIVVEFPDGGLPPGDYTLAISSGPGKRKNDEKSLTVGNQGPQGDQGDQGDQGEQGPTGVTGPQGPPGPQGSQGPPGPSGSTGPAGPQGNQGDPGPKGDQGDPGNDGADGDDGADGQDGADGTDGNNGALRVAATEPLACFPQGGRTIEFGTDTNGNNQLDDGEVIGSFNVCNGTSGADGSDGNNGALRVAATEPFACFPQGGRTIEFGTDTNGNNQLDDGEVIGSFNVCNGSPGADGAEGPPGVSGYGTSGSNNAVTSPNLGTGSSIDGSQSCPTGKKIITGGCEVTAGTFAYLTASRPNNFSNPTAWYCKAVNGGPPAQVSISIRPICANVE